MKFKLMIIALLSFVACACETIAEDDSPELWEKINQNAQ